LILDACVVIQLHELGRWQQVVDQCDIHLSEIVARHEVRFDDANGTRINLMSAIQSNAITLFSVNASKIHAFRTRFDDSYLGVLDDGEAESLAYLFDAKNDFLIASADKIVYRILGNMHRGDQGISLEEILNKIGLTASQLPSQYRREFRERWTQVGFDERLQGLGLKSDSAAN
jgi:hypothetical protein